MGAIVKNMFQFLMVLIAIIVALCLFSGAVSLLKYVGMAFIVIVGAKFLTKKVFKKE